MPPSPGNKALLRDYENPLVSLNKALFPGGGGIGGVPLGSLDNRIGSGESFSLLLAQSFQFSQVLPLLKGLAIDLARVFLKKPVSHGQKPGSLTFPLYWLFDRDPYNGLL